jgi:CRISPR-associated endonuclease Cas2
VRDFAFPVQFSVFETSLKSHEMKDFVRRVKAEINPDEDKVEIFKLYPASTRIWLGNVTNNGKALIF